MKRPILSLIATGITLVILAIGCGPADEDATPTSPPSAPTATATTAVPGAPTATATTVVAAPTATATQAVVDDMPGPVKGGILRAINESGISTLDAQFTSQYSAKNVANHIFERLLDWDHNFVLRGTMVDWTMTSDQKSFVFTLRDGQTWHDGRPVTMDDIMASLDRWINNSRCSPSSSCGLVMGHIVGDPTPIDAKSFSITTDVPLAGLLHEFATRGGLTGHMYPEEIGSIDPLTNFLEVLETEEVIGSGAYALKNWVKGDRQELARHEGYVKRTDTPGPDGHLGIAGARHAYLDEIWIMEVPDPTTRLAAIQAGDVEFIMEISPDFYQVLVSDPNVQIFGIRPGFRPFFWPNHEAPPTNNQEILFGLMQSSDHQTALLAGIGDANFMEYPCYAQRHWCREIIDGVPSEKLDNPWPTMVAGDPEGGYARAVAAGYAGEPIVLLAAEDKFWSANMIRTYAQQWADAGFNIDHQVMDDAATKQARRTELGWNVVLTNGKAHNIGYQPGRTTCFAGGVPRYHPTARQMELGELLFFESDPAVHLNLLLEMQESQWTDGCGFYPVTGTLDILQAGSAKIHNYWPYHESFLTNAWLEQ